MSKRAARAVEIAVDADVDDGHSSPSADAGAHSSRYLPGRKAERDWIV